MSETMKKQDVIFYMTEVAKRNGALTKRIKPDGKGGIIKDASQCRLTDGSVEILRLSLLELASKYLRSLPPNKAIVHGLPFGSSPGDKFNVVSEQLFSDQPGTITRTKKYFGYPENKPGLGLFDFDPQEGQAVLSPEEFVTIISSIFPPYKDAAKVTTPSTSACIYDAAGRELKGIGGGFHQYFVALNPVDLPRFADVLFKRLWLAGYGYIFITKSGAQLPRTLFDKSVFSPERLCPSGKPA